ncbi:MAG: hypothetical protein ACYTF3_01955 [Planctomycetota bacterium]|jgi:hypothetical protein
MKNFLPAALLLAACAGPQADDGHAQLADAAAPPTGAPATFEEWIESLPSAGEAAAQPFRADFSGEMTMDIVGMVDMSDPTAASVGITMAGTMTVADPTRLRYEVDLGVDLSAIPEAEIPGPLALGLLLVSDGETMHVVPEFKDDWLREQLASTGMGLESMVFTLDMGLVEDMLAFYLRAFEQGGMDMSMLVPEGMSMEEFFRNSMNPALWSRSFLATTDIDSFEVDGDEVRIDARIKEELFESMMMQPVGGQEQVYQSMTYEMIFDRYSGLPTRMVFVAAGEDGWSLRMVMDTGPYLLGDAALAGVDFGYEMADGQTEFPLDPWVSLMLTQMEAMIQEEDEDTSF